MLDLERSNPDYLSYAGLIEAADSGGLSVSCWFKRESQTAQAGLFASIDTLSAYKISLYVDSLIGGPGVIAQTENGISAGVAESSNTASVLGEWYCAQGSWDTSNTYARLSSRYEIGSWASAGGLALPILPTYATRIGAFSAAPAANTTSWDGQIADFLIVGIIRNNGVLESIDVVLDGHAMGIPAWRMLHLLANDSIPYYYWRFRSASDLTDEVGGSITFTTTGSPATANDFPPFYSTKPRIVVPTRRRVIIDGKLMLVS